MRKLIVLMAAMVVLGGTGRVFAAEHFGADAYDDSQSNPLRIAAYLIHPIGYTLEWLVTRPFHELVAQPDLEPIFGHESHAYYGESPVGSETGDISVRRLRTEPDLTEMK
jgi:hypothetical protein